MKKFIFPVCVVAYLAFVTLTIKPTAKQYSMEFILESIGTMPKALVIVLLLVGITTTAMLGMYIRAKKEGAKDVE